MKIIRRKFHLKPTNSNIFDSFTDVFLAEEIPENIEEDITWENLDNCSYFNPVFDHSVHKTKKGRKLTWYYNHISKVSFKEWKKPLNLHLTIEYSETTLSINELFKISDSEKVIQYLLERGINFLETP